jgi:hypothetical protein
LGGGRKKVFFKKKQKAWNQVKLPNLGGGRGGQNWHRKGGIFFLIVVLGREKSSAKKTPKICLRTPILSPVFSKKFPYQKLFHFLVKKGGGEIS